METGGIKKNPPPPGNGLIQRTQTFQNLVATSKF